MASVRKRGLEADGHAVDVAEHTGRQEGLRHQAARANSLALIGFSRSHPVAREEATVRFAPTVVASIEPVRDVVKIVGVSDDPEAMAAAAFSVEERFGQSVSAVRSQPYYLEITHPQANKGAVVDYAVSQLGIPAQAVAVLGDMPNDLLMFEKAALRIAMGNAMPEVKARADHVTKSNDDEGFANAVDWYVLEPAGATRRAVQERRFDGHDDT